MKNKTPTLFNLLGCALCATFATTALANHQSGDDPLPEIMTAGDFNGDGNLDLAVNISGYDMFAVLNGDGQGNFTLKRHIQTDTLPKCLRSGDINGDGKLDILAITQWGYNIKIFLGTGTGSFQHSKTLNGDGEPNRLRLADLNKDGRLDIMATGPQEGALLIYFGLSAGNFTDSALEFKGYPNLVAINTGDFNNDSKVDIAFSYFENSLPGGTHLQILHGNGFGGFTLGQNLVTESQCNNVEVNDLNKDGNLDIVLAGAGSENESGLFISSYLGDGTGKFTAQQSIPLGEGSTRGEISLGDFNEDGNIDIAFPLTSDLTLGKKVFSKSVFIYLGDGLGNFTKGTTLTAEESPGSTWAADFNKDGHIDLACSNRTKGSLTIFIGNGDGTFATRAHIPLDVLPTP